MLKQWDLSSSPCRQSLFPELCQSCAQDAPEERFDSPSVSHLECCHWVQMKPFTRLTCTACYLWVRAWVGHTAAPACFVLAVCPHSTAQTRPLHPKQCAHFCWAKYITSWEEQQTTSKRLWWFVMRDCTQLLLYDSQANLKFGNRVVACLAPGTNGCCSQLGEHNPGHIFPAKVRASAEMLFLLPIPGRQEALISSWTCF